MAPAKTRIGLDPVSRVEPDEAPTAVLAAIDIGSTAIRMVVGQVDSEGNLCELESLSRGVSMGKDVFTDGHISEQSIQTACEILRGYKQIMDTYGVKRYRAVATSAARDAINTDTFIDRVFLRTGLDVEVIDGAEENRLTFLAVADLLHGSLQLGAREALLAEVGGGGADITLIRNGGPVYAGTYPLGTLGMRQYQAAGVGGSYKRRISLLDRHIYNILEGMRRSVNFSRISHVLALGGDVRFAARQIEGDPRPVYTIPREKFLKFCDEISRFSEEELVERYHLSYVEAETLVPALRVYKQLVERTSAQTVVVSNSSIRHGVLQDLLGRGRRHGMGELSQQILDSARELTRKYQADEAHGVHVAELAVQIFDQLAAEHGLDERARVLLQAAAMLHDVGLFINTREHHKHSQYLIANSDVFGLNRHETELVATIARYHRRALPQRSHPAYRSLDAEERMIVCKLAAILRVANALDVDHTQKICKVEIERRDEEILLRVYTPSDADLSVGRHILEKKADLFEEIYGKRITLQQISQ